MVETKSITIQELFPVREVKEEINLFMFNSSFFSFQDMKIYNQIMEVLADAKIEVPVYD